jgi:hypothetical protein
MRLNAIEQARNARAAFIGDQCNAVPTPCQFLSQRMGRHHMSAGAACGENEVPLAHRLLHFTT